MTSKNFLRKNFALFAHLMWAINVMVKLVICFCLEAVMIAFIFTYSRSLNAPNTESKTSFEAATTHHVFFRNTSGSSELPNELVSKIQFGISNPHEVSIDIDA